jgi:6-pyruvoyltetrahydropterin/6-carboxytetrahydropterin synthase
MLTITRKLEIDAGHRLQRHESKCFSPHGHRYVVEVTVTAPELDSVGRIVDFSELKSICAKWLDDNWDHAFIYEQGDPIGEFLTKHEMKRYCMLGSPTVENLVRLFASEVSPALAARGLSLVRVLMYETPNCYANWHAPV